MYRLIYDSGAASYDIWSNLGPRPLLVAVGAIFTFFPRLSHALPKMLRGPRWFWPVFFGGTLLLTAIQAVTTFSSYQRYHTAALSGGCRTIEGIVRDFHPMALGGHSDESFDLDGIAFAYSDYELSGGYNRTISRGGAIHGSDYVRLCYVPTDGRNVIVRLEIRD